MDDGPKRSLSLRGAIMQFIPAVRDLRNADADARIIFMIRTITTVAIVMFVATLPVHYVQGSTLWIFIDLFNIAFLFLVAAYSKNVENRRLCALATISWVFTMWCTWLGVKGSFQDEAIVWYAIFPFFAFSLLGTRYGLLWTACMLAVLVCALLARYSGFDMIQYSPMLLGEAITAVIAATVFGAFFTHRLEHMETKVIALEEKNAELQEELERKINRIKFLDTSDPLSGLLNRRAFCRYLESHLNISRNTHTAPGYLIIARLDKLFVAAASMDAVDSTINRYGIMITNLLRNFGDGNLIGRWSDRSIVIAVPGWSDEAARALCNQLAPLASGDAVLGGCMQLEVGMVPLEIEDSAEEALARAEAASYERRDLNSSASAEFITVGNTK